MPSFPPGRASPPRTTRSADVVGTGRDDRTGRRPRTAGGATAGARYVQLSPAYTDAAAEARARGWAVVGEPSGSHLDIATEPARIADLLG